MRSGELLAGLRELAAAGVHDFTPVLVECRARDWEGDFIFNPKQISARDGRLEIALHNGHCVVKPLVIVIDHLQGFDAAMPADIRMEDKGNVIEMAEPAIEIRHEPDQMAVKLVVRRDG